MGPHAGKFAASVAVHVPFWQQPVGHETISQTQVLLAHRCPAAQAMPLPHAQAPSGVQLSARPDGHGRHCAPSAPQLLIEAALQVSPEQH